MFGGAVAGAASGYVGCAIAASGIPMASTAAIAGASFPCARLFRHREA